MAFWPVLWPGLYLPKLVARVARLEEQVAALQEALAGQQDGFRNQLTSAVRAIDSLLRPEHEAEFRAALEALRGNLEALSRLVTEHQWPRGRTE